MTSVPFSTARQQTLASFDWQWAHLPEGDFMPGDPWFDAHAAQLLAREFCGVAPEWFAGKSVLDAGCGQGRWTRALLELGARVTAIDFSEAGLRRTRQLAEQAGQADWLETARVDLLDIPAELAERRFDFVYSFGVLHHTGDTWLALENVSRLVGAGGGMFLYLYGEPSWSAEHRQKIERVRQELAPLPFEEKITELRRRFPDDDPHQLFDLLSPVINDRVRFEDVTQRLRPMGFARVDETMSTGEVWVRAVRDGFPERALLTPVGRGGMYQREASLRFEGRLGAAFENKVRAATRHVAQRPARGWLREALGSSPASATVFDASFAPDRVSAAEAGDRNLVWWDGESLLTPGAAVHEAYDVVVLAGASSGACRFPDRLLERLWARVRPGGTLLVEIAERPFPRAQRGPLDKVRDRSLDVPGKVAALLDRHADWSVGEALSAVGGGLLNPIARDGAESALRDAGGVSSAEWLPARPGAVLLRARRSS